MATPDRLGGLVFWVFFIISSGLGVYSATPVGMGTRGCLSVVSPANPCDLVVSSVTPMGLSGGGVLPGVISGRPMGKSGHYREPDLLGWTIGDTFGHSRWPGGRG